MIREKSIKFENNRCATQAHNSRYSRLDHKIFDNGAEEELPYEGNVLQFCPLIGYCSVQVKISFLNAWDKLCRWRQSAANGRQ